MNVTSYQRENLVKMQILLMFFQKKKGRVSGVVYGGNSRKIKNYLQISNKLFVVFNSKSENKLGYFKTELVKPISPLYFNDKKRSSALISLCSLLNLLLPEAQPNTNIYKSFEEFINSIYLDNWIILYIFLELGLIKDLGYDPNLNKFNKDSSNLNDVVKVKIDTFNYEVPLYLITKNIPSKISNILIKKSLYFTRNIIQNRFFYLLIYLFQKQEYF